MSIRNRGSLSAAAIAAGVLAGLVGCASTPQASLERDRTAKRFEAVTRDAVLYLYRPDPPGTGPQTTLLIDDLVVGSMPPSTFFRLTLLPGRHVIEAMPPDPARLAVELRGYDVSYVAVHGHGSREGSADSVLRRVPATRARAAIRACCSLLEAWPSGEPRLVW